jgi:hypothetical protein
MREADYFYLDYAALVAAFERVRRGGNGYMLEPLPAHGVDRKMRVYAAGKETGAGVITREG